MSLSEQRYAGSIGKRVGFGQCGSLTSDFFQSQTGYNFADAVTNPAPMLPSAPHDGYFATAWDVYNQVDWGALGYEKIDNPTFGNVRDDDTFYIRPREGLPTGHTGLIASTAGNNITTLEQNVNGALYVQKLSNENSWSWYGGFDGIVRKKAETQPTTGDIRMYLIQIVDTNTKYKGRWYISDGVSCRYVRTPRMLANYQNQYGKLNLRVDRMYSSELFKEFGGEQNIK
ncbi:MAG: hypothetical protein ACRCX2_38770 [Paraclostridium sp.]